MTADSSQAIGLSTINGLPAHILIVHAVVVFVPLAAIGVVASLRRRTARRLGPLVPGTAVVALISVLLAMNAGGWLQDHVQNTALVRRHTDLGGQLWPFSLGVLLVSMATWWLSRRDAETPSTAPQRERGNAVTAVIVGVLAIVLAVGSIVQVIRIGDSGSRAAWQNHFTESTTYQHHG